MNVEKVAKSKSITAAIVAMISILGATQTAYADVPVRTPCHGAMGLISLGGGMQILCSESGFWLSSGDLLVIENWDKDGCPVSRETIFYGVDPATGLREKKGSIVEDRFVGCNLPGFKTYYDGNGKVTKEEHLYFGEDGHLTKTDGFVYDDNGELKEEVISDQYYDCKDEVLKNEGLYLDGDFGPGIPYTPGSAAFTLYYYCQVAGRVTHRTGLKLQKAETSIYDGDGHLVSVTTFDDHGLTKRSDARPPFTLSGQSEVPVSSLPNGSGHGSGHVDSLSSGTPTGAIAGAVGGSGGDAGSGNKDNIIWQRSSSAVTNTESSDSGVNFATGGTAGVSDGQSGIEHKKKVLHPGSSLSAENSATGGTAGVASERSGTATGATAGAVGPGAGSATGAASTSGLHPGAKWHQNLTGGNIDASATQNTSAGSTNSSGGQTGAGSKNQIIWQKPSSAATNLGTSSTGENSATGGTAGVANGLSAQSDAENKRKIIWQKSSSGGATSSVTTATSSGSGSSRRKLQSKKSLNSPSHGGASIAVNVKGSSQSGRSAHPTPTPSNRKKRDSSGQQ